MSASSSDLSLRSAEPAEEDIIRRWLAAPHVTRWTHRVFSTISGALDSLSRDTDASLLIVEHAGQAIGCAHVYGAEGDPRWKAIADVTGRTRAIDFLIGDSAFLNRKHGQALLRALATQIFRDPEIDRVVACPHPDNWPAVIALKRAGFREKGRHPDMSMNAMYLTVTPHTLKR
ncbi:GNAT family N-acetyltransferase [Nisaea sp.]|uniref:GNAT family N-acetyltransferase n=1 Tax=Nisaea sp. TaxID=2024842 RepID=UPI0032EBED0D